MNTEKFLEFKHTNSELAYTFWKPTEYRHVNLMWVGVRFYFVGGYTDVNFKLMNIALSGKRKVFWVASDRKYEISTTHFGTH